MIVDANYKQGAIDYATKIFQMGGPLAQGVFGMMKLVDGPAKGTYMCRRAPLYLRAVVNDKGGTDALDMPSDTPTDLEAIHVYRRIGGHSMVHLNMADRRMSGFYARADYEWMPDVDGEYVRETTTWRRWVEEAEAGRILTREGHGDV